VSTLIGTTMTLFKKLADALWHALARRILPGPTLRIGRLDHIPDAPARRRKPNDSKRAAQGRTAAAQSTSAETAGS